MTLEIRIGGWGPICPKCDCDTFDDWWHDSSCRDGGGVVVSIYATLTCHECGERFDVTKYVDGETHTRWPSLPLLQQHTER